MTVVGTWTYTGNPATDAKDAVRFHIGDTKTADQQLSDEEILWLLSTYGGTLNSAYHAALSLEAIYARDVDKQVGDLRIAASQRRDGYTVLAKNIKRRITSAASPYGGGISISDKSAVVSDSNRVAPVFYRGQLDYPSSS